MGTKLEQRGPLLLTHWGFSGPAVLKLSAWAARELANAGYKFVLRVNWTPQQTDDQLRDEMNRYRQQHPKKQVINQALFGLPARLWRALTEEAGIAEMQRWADLPAKNQNRLIEKLVNSQFQVTGKSTFKDEFVTCGGIALGNLDPQTLESRAQPGLFLPAKYSTSKGYRRVQFPECLDHRLPGRKTHRSVIFHVRTSFIIVKRLPGPLQLQ